MPGSGLALPLDLGNIAARCKGSFYAPRRFAAVQLAYSNPRCRVLVFRTFLPLNPCPAPPCTRVCRQRCAPPPLADTGRLVGTGTTGQASARLAIARAQLQLAEEANVHLHVRNFQVCCKKCTRICQLLVHSILLF